MAGEVAITLNQIIAIVGGIVIPISGLIGVSHRGQRIRLDEIRNKVNETNGRVGKLELWSNLHQASDEKQLTC